METCIDCGRTIPEDTLPKCGEGWILDKGAGYICPACCDAQTSEYLTAEEA